MVGTVDLLKDLEVAMVERAAEALISLNRSSKSAWVRFAGLIGATQISF